MSNYPLTAVERQARRDALLAQAIRSVMAQRMGLSIKCGDMDQHSTDDGGCANDGTGCLCECHDPKPCSCPCVDPGRGWPDPEPPVYEPAEDCPQHGIGAPHTAFTEGPA